VMVTMRINHLQVQLAGMVQALDMDRVSSRQFANPGLLGKMVGVRQCKADLMQLTVFVSPSLNTQRSKLGVPFLSLLASQVFS
jgi:hypothetical protein